jgi:hypothetical protein
MPRSLLPLLLCALVAGPAAAQIGSASGGTPVKAGIQSAKSTPPVEYTRPVGGVRSATREQHPGEDSMDAYKQLQLLKAKFEAAKASGKVCPERMAHQEARLKELEAQLQPKVAPVRPPGGVRSIKDK